LLAGENCLAATEAPCEIQIWDLATAPKRADAIEAPSPYINALGFSADNRLLATVDIGSDDPAIRLWDLEAGRSFGAPMRTRARTFSPGLEPTSNATGEASVSLWDVPTQELITETPVESLGGVNTLAFTSDGTLLAAGHGRGEVRLLNTTDPSAAGFEYKAPSGVFDVEFSPDGAYLATTSHEDDHLLLWSPTTDAPEQLSGHQGQTFDIAFSDDGVRFVSAGSDGPLIVWGAGHNDALQDGVVLLHGGTVSAIAFDGESVVTVGRALSDDLAVGAPEIGRWDTQTDGSQVTALPADGVFAVSPDGRVVAIGDAEGRITQLDSGTGDNVGPDHQRPRRQDHRAGDQSGRPKAGVERLSRVERAVLLRRHRRTGAVGQVERPRNRRSAHAHRVHPLVPQPGRTHRGRVDRRPRGVAVGPARGSSGAGDPRGGGPHPPGAGGPRARPVDHGAELDGSVTTKRAPAS
jgi:WD40 repeat protein